MMWKPHLNPSWWSLSHISCEPSSKQEGDRYPTQSIKEMREETALQVFSTNLKDISANCGDRIERREWAVRQKLRDGERKS